MTPSGPISADLPLDHEGYVDVDALEPLDQSPIVRSALQVAGAPLSDVRWNELVGAAQAEPQVADLHHDGLDPAAHDHARGDGPVHDPVARHHDSESAPPDDAKVNHGLAPGTDPHDKSAQPPDQHAKVIDLGLDHEADRHVPDLVDGRNGPVALGEAGGVRGRTADEALRHLDGRGDGLDPAPHHPQAGHDDFAVLDHDDPLGHDGLDGSVPGDGHHLDHLLDHHDGFHDVGDHDRAHDHGLHPMDDAHLHDAGDRDQDLDDDL